MIARSVPEIHCTRGFCDEEEEEEEEEEELGILLLNRAPVCSELTQSLYLVPPWEG